MSAEKKEKKYLIDNAQLIAEWDWDKNNGLGFSPTAITYGSIQKVWWVCKKGHEWQATPNNRSNGQGCPFCSGKKVLRGYNDLESQFPEIADEWHPTLNNDLHSYEVTKGSSKRVWWKCKDCNYEWQSSVSNRTAGKGCPICGRKKQGHIKEQNLIAVNGSFADNYPDLLLDWDYDKNSISPNLITANSTKRVWWRCKTCNYSWQTTVSHRTLREHGCPACGNKVVTIYNCLSSTHPQILDKWDYGKNIDITPNDVTFGSNKKVWWMCEKGHEWQATVSAIVSGGKCPICCGQQVLQGYNDLKTTNPYLAEQWHPTKNGNLFPTQITAGSSRDKVWWLCPKGHEYKATVANRSNGTGCPICDKESKTSFPEQAIFFHLSKVTKAYNRFLLNDKIEIDVYLPELNIGIEYDGLYFHNSEKAKEKENLKNKILREAGIFLIRVKETKERTFIDTDATIYCKNSGNSLFIKDVIERLIEKINYLKSSTFVLDINIDRDSAEIYSQYLESEKENSLLTRNPQIAKEWHPTKNGFVKPDMVSFASAKKVWWLGECGHEWQMSIQSRNRGANCPYCAGKKVLKGFNDLATTNPELLDEWDYKKNIISPNEISCGSDKKVWWLCETGHSYSATVSNRVYGKCCPECSVNKRVYNKNKNRIEKIGSLQETHPLLAKEWHNTLNGDLTPEQVTYGSDKKVWWICSKGHNYQASISNRVYGKGCPICAGKKIVSGINDLVTLNPSLAREWDYDKNILKPTEISPNSHKKVWWKCKEGHSWESQIKSRNNGTGCPKCAKAKKGKKEVKS